MIYGSFCAMTDERHDHWQGEAADRVSAGNVRIKTTSYVHSETVHGQHPDQELGLCLRLPNLTSHEYTQHHS